MSEVEGRVYSPDEPISGVEGARLYSEIMAAKREAGRTLPPCDACTGDGGRGHTLRGACMGAPCPECGDARYQHLNGEHGIAVRETAPVRLSSPDADSA